MSVDTNRGTAADFYDTFADTFVRDYVRGNRRVEAQRRFVLDSLPRNPASVLVVGCGIGQVAAAVAKRNGNRTRVLGIDLSERALKVGRALYPYRNLAFSKTDILTNELDGSWDAIVLPDVYEHIPRLDRASLDHVLGGLLAPKGVLVLTCPTPAHQARLRAVGHGLQPVDEDVTFDDVADLSRAVQPIIVHYSLVSIWMRGDYFHAAMQRFPQHRRLGDRGEQWDSAPPVRPQGAARVLGAIGWGRRSLSMPARRFHAGRALRPKL